MRRPSFPILLVLLLAACNGDSPTEPLAAPQRAGTNADPVHRISITPDPVVVQPGRTFTAAINSEWPFGLGAQFRSSDPSIAMVSGSLEPGMTSTTVTITGVREGETLLYVIIPNFARPPGTGNVSPIHVRTPLRRRAVRQ